MAVPYSAAHMMLLLEQCKVHADICGGSMVRGPQTILEWSEPVFFSIFGRHIFGTFRDEAVLLCSIMNLAS